MVIRSLIPDFLRSDKPEYKTIEATAPGTTLKIHVTGLGDLMMGRQFISGFIKYLKKIGDPELGDVSLSAGGYMPKHGLPESETTIYWWYSFGPIDDTPEQFLSDYFKPNTTNVGLDLILCGSKEIQREAEQAGYNTLYFPIATSRYEPLQMKRSGFGYAGSKGHKKDEKVQNIMGQYIPREDFEWVDHFEMIDELNLWYNTKLMTFGLTKEGQRQWGVVNSRVFESLASGTPLLLGSHPTVEDVLGFEYPYQVSNSEDVDRLVTEITNEPESHLKTFKNYSKIVRDQHSYFERTKTLVNELD